MTITLSAVEIAALTDYEQPTKQLRVLHNRGFTRAFINRSGRVVLERGHYEAIISGQQLRESGAKANLSFLRAA